jgi:hypothetical protein
MGKFELGQKLFIVGRETVEINCPVCKAASSFEAPNTCEGCLGTSVVQISVPVAERVEVRATNNLRSFDCEEDVFGSEDEIIEKQRSEYEEREEYVASELRQYNAPDGVN